MSRTLGGALATHLASSTHTRARMVRIDLKDGSTIAVTDHDRALAFDLGDGSETYSPRTGIIASDLALSTGFDADDVEISGPIVETATQDWHVTRAAVLGGRFDDATVRFFEVNWNSLSSMLGNCSSTSAGSGGSSGELPGAMPSAMHSPAFR